MVGAGFAGLYAVHRARVAGLTVAGIEAGHDVGGVWYWNRYPGARCDIESIEYSYSFDEQIQQEWVWTERFAAQPEIRSYIEFVADKLDLRRSFIFERRVVSAAWDEDALRWELVDDYGDRYRARYAVMATGILSAPKVPDIEGLTDFAGDVLLTSSWPDDANLDGRRVAVIGTGSTGIQAIPLIARRAEHLYVLQRTPSYTLPAHNRPLAPGELDAVKSNYNALGERERYSKGGIVFATTERPASEFSEGERRAIYEEVWREGSPFRFQAVFSDLRTDAAANATAVEFVTEKVRELVANPDLTEKLIPDYPLATRRLCIDTGYYETYRRANVELVDLKEQPITRVAASGIELSDGTFLKVDAIVIATGFDAVTGALRRIDIAGRGGRRLSEYWADAPHSFLGLLVAGFPNMFTITGPSNPGAFSNMVVSIEQHVDLAFDAIAWADRRGFSIETTEEVQDVWAGHNELLSSRTLLMQTDS